MISKSIEHICKDYTKIENYDKAIADDSQTWICHHRNERFYTQKELIDLGLYYNCPPCELIFLTYKQHRNTYHKGNDSEIAKTKMSKSVKLAHKNKKWSFPNNEEIRKNRRKSLLGKKKSDSHKMNISKSKLGPKNPSYGKHWYTNGVINKLCLTCPDGFRPGRVR